MIDVSGFFTPRSIAIIGASENPEKIGSIVIQNLLHANYSGTIYPVNLHSKEILGLTSYSTLTALPEVPDLVIISIPVQGIMKAMEEIQAIGCKTVVVFTAGFKEIGEEGIAIEEQLKMFALEHTIALLGPNCLGYLTTPSKINATFAAYNMQQGSLKLLSQSGALASAFLDRSQATGVGIESCFTLGNKSVLAEHDFLHYRLENSRPGPIGLYLESIADGSLFMKSVKTLCKQQPIFLLKPGKSDAAQHAMQSHTGSLAGEDVVLQAVCKQSGVIRCDDIRAFFNCAMYFSWQQAPRGKRIAIISNAGGPAVITTDLIEEAGMEVAIMSQKTKEILSAVLPRAASVINPIDVLGDAHADRYQQALEAMIQEEEVDGIIVLLTPQVMTQIKETAEVVTNFVKTYKKPVVCSFIGHEHVNEGILYLHEHHIPCYADPVDAVRVLSQAYTRYVASQKESEYVHDVPSTFTTPTIPAVSGPVQDTVLEPWLKSNGFLLPQSHVVEDVDESVARAERLGFPVVAKLSGASLLHKLDVHGVYVNLRTEDHLRAALDGLSKTKQKLEAAGKGPVSIRLQKQITKGVEIIIGCKTDSSFGRVWMIGAGGTLTNLLKDHTLSVAPNSKSDIADMVSRSSIAPLLQGYRNQKTVGIDAVVECIWKLVQLVEKNEHILEFEVNPCIVNADGIRLVDPKMIVK